MRGESQRIKNGGGGEELGERRQRLRKRGVSELRPDERRLGERMRHDLRGVMWGGRGENMALHRLPVHACQLESG